MLHQGDVAVYNSGVPHEERSVGPDPFKVICCGVGQVHIDGIPPDQLLPAFVDPVIFCEKYAFKVESYLSEMLQECDSQILGDSPVNYPDQTPHRGGQTPAFGNRHARL